MKIERVGKSDISNLASVSLLTMFGVDDSYHALKIEDEAKLQLGGYGIRINRSHDGQASSIVIGFSDSELPNRPFIEGRMIPFKGTNVTVRCSEKLPGYHVVNRPADKFGNVYQIKHLRGAELADFKGELVRLDELTFKKLVY